MSENEFTLVITPQDQSPDYITKKEAQEMVDKAIRQHNRNATIISAILGSTVLAFYVHGLLELVNRN